MMRKRKSKLPFKGIYFRNIASIITLSFILVTFIPIAGLCIYAYSYLSQNIYQDYYNKSAQVISGIDSNLNIFFNGLKQITDSMFAAESIQIALSDPAVTYKEQIQQDEMLNDYIKNLLGGRADIACISLYNADYEEIFEYNIRRLKDVHPYDDEVLDLAKDYNCKFTIFGPRYEIFGSDYQRNIFTVGRQIKNIDSGEVIGYMIIDFDYSSLEKTIGNSDNDNNSVMFILDREDKVVYNSLNSDDITLKYTDTGAYAQFAEQKNDLTVLVESEYFNWNYCIMSNGEAMLEKLMVIALKFILVGSLSFLVFLLCSILISKSVSKPLKRLEDAMRTAESNRFNDILQPIETYEEVGRLTRRFNVMLVEIRRLLDQEKESWQREAESEYKALQLQITPHFLYNSLDSINCLAQIHGRDDISEMVLSLAGIFKYTMKYDSSFATLEEEIDHVKNYCMLQAIHYQDRFTIEYDVEKRFLSRQVIKFMLQPIVENAIHHGIKDQELGNKITITAYETTEDFVIQVSDNGAGMEPEKERYLREHMEQPADQLFQFGKEGEHIGMVNINLRLKIQYGEKAGITFFTREDEGTDIYLHIPFEKETEDENV